MPALGALGRRCASVATRTGANRPHYSIDRRMFCQTDICGSRARLEGHEQGLQRVVGSVGSLPTNKTDIM